MTDRREFLTAAAILLGLKRGAPTMNGDLLCVGTYTEGTRSEGVYLLRMDRRSGELRIMGSVNAGPNPSFLAIHPNGRALYAVNEVEQGAVSAFAIARESGGLTRLNAQPSQGASPCFVSVDRTGRVALIANYMGGSVALLPIQPDGGLATAAEVVRHTGTGPNAERQEAPHAHCILPDRSGRFALAADLGADRVFVYHLDPTGKSLRPVESGALPLRPGSGPRHLAFHPSAPLVFIANELDATVATLRFDAERGALSLLDARSTLPAGWSGTNYPADIHVAPGGRTVYVSNRGHNSIAVFSVTGGAGGAGGASGAGGAGGAGGAALALEQVISTEGDWPRNFSLDPTGRWLLVANQRSDSVVVFARDPDTGRLTQSRQRVALPSPVCLRFA